MSRSASILFGAAILAAGAAAFAQTPPPQPACAGAEHRQLDFWVGEWRADFDLPGGKRGTATNRITRDEYGACVITEHFYQPDIDYRGHSVSMYDAKTKQWRQTWVDSQGSYIALAGGPVSGQPHSFELATVQAGPSLSRMVWQDVKPDSFTWRWQKRASEGAAWEDSWVIRYSRAK